MVLFSVFVFIHSTSEVGSMLLILRCVDPRDKAMALGLIQFAIGLFGNYAFRLPPSSIIVSRDGDLEGRNLSNFLAIRMGKESEENFTR